MIIAANGATHFFDRGHTSRLNSYLAFNFSSQSFLLQSGRLSPARTFLLLLTHNRPQSIEVTFPRLSADPCAGVRLFRVCEPFQIMQVLPASLECHAFRCLESRFTTVCHFSCSRMSFPYQDATRRYGAYRLYHNAKTTNRKHP